MAESKREDISAVTMNNYAGMNIEGYRNMCDWCFINLVPKLSFCSIARLCYVAAAEVSFDIIYFLASPDDFGNDKLIQFVHNLQLQYPWLSCKENNEKVRIYKNDFKKVFHFHWETWRSVHLRIIDYGVEFWFAISLIVEWLLAIQ